MAAFKGTAARNVIYGTSKDDTIMGMAGNDHLLGQGGRDIIDGGSGDDKLDGGLGIDTLTGGDGKDFLTGGAGDDFLYAGTGDDYLYDLDGKNIMRGEDGNDRLVGNADSSVDGGTGLDTLVAEIAAPLEVTGSGHYTGGDGYNFLRINGGAGTAPADNYTFVRITGTDANGLIGEVGRQDSIENSDTWTRAHSFNFDGIREVEVTANSKLYFEGRIDTDGGDKGQFHIKGGDSADFITLGSDHETVTLGKGADSVYVSGFLPGPDGVFDFGADHIMDFNAAEGDTLLVGWGGEGTRVEITEDSLHTFVRSFIDGQEAAVNGVVIDAVGIRDSIVTDWQAV